MAWQQHTIVWLATAFLGVALTGCASGQSEIFNRTGQLGVVPLSASGSASVPRLQMGESQQGPVTPAPPGPPDGRFAVRVRATVNGVAILDEELRSAIYPMLLELN